MLEPCRIRTTGPPRHWTNRDRTTTIHCMRGFLLVFIGAGVGGSLRHAINLGSLRLFGPHLPIGTFAINVVGSFLIGLFAGHAASSPSVDPHLRLFVMTGLLGGFTTFSAYSLEGVSLWQRGETTTAVLYVTGSVVISLAAATAGMAITRS